MKNKPKLPNKIEKSTQVGVKYPQLDGKKSLCKDEAIIINLSNHIPTLTRTTTMNITGSDLLNFLNQNNCGKSELQETIIQYPQA